MARTILYTALVILIVGCAYAQVPGGFNNVEVDRYPEILKTVNGLTHTGDFANAHLVEVKCAKSQVVAGANYQVYGIWDVGTEKKTCTIKYSRSLSGTHEVTGYDCTTPLC